MLLTEEGQTGPRPWYKTVLLWICGIDKAVTEEAADRAQHISLDEKRKWRIVCNVAAVILMAAGVFLFAFWA